ncbi:MAG: LysR family transcriptional regulator [Planctomycetes bacterium]|nr:LysR family transcriptional regulator [Planctomycetota bacterium]
MSLELLRTLSAVARRGAITGAARSLGLTQPALTRRLQQLEEEFGVALLERSRKGARLTEVGRLVEEEGRQLLERYERLKETVGAHLRLERGTIRIGGGAAAVSFLLPEIIRAFRAAHPDVVFQLKEAGSREIEGDVLREELELGVVTLPVRSKELTVVPIHKDPIVLVAARDHPLAAAPRPPLKSIAGLPLIGFERGSAIRRIIDRALEQRGIAMRVVMELRSIQSILRMVELNQGLAFVSLLGVEAARADVRVLQVPGLRIQRTLALIRGKSRPLSLAAAALLQTLQPAAAGVGWRRMFLWT